MAIASILSSVKKALGLAEEYEPFDPEILMHINSVFSTLNDLGIGPDEGFMIEDKDATWDSYLGEELRLNNVKTYMFLRVKRLFDPPTQSYVLDSLDRQIAELEWRINRFRESQVNPIVVLPDPDLDGGGVMPDPTSGWTYDGGTP